MTTSGLSFKQSLVFMLIAALVIGGVAVAVPPTQSKMYDILTRGLTGDPERKTTVVGTTPDDLLDTDLTSSPNQRTDAFTQLLVVSNRDSVKNICVGGVAWSGVTTCAALCAASALTCSGAATDGSLVPPGSQRPFRYDGQSCMCVVGSAAGSPFQGERVLR